MDDGVFVDLWVRARRGDETAIRDLLQSFGDDVRRMVRARLPRVLRSQFDSMDFVQEVWQSVFVRDGESEPEPEPEPAASGRFDNAQHLRAYVAGVVRNKVFQEHRRRTQTRKYDLAREEPLHGHHPGREGPRDLPAPDPTPSQNVQAQDRWDQLLAGRSPREAQVIDLRRQGLTFPEISEQTGLHDRTVRRIIDDARRRLEARRWQ